MKARSARQQNPQRQTKEREDEAAEMRLSGMTYSEIGRRLGYSTSMANQLASTGCFRIGRHDAVTGGLKNYKRKFDAT